MRQLAINKRLGIGNDLLEDKFIDTTIKSYFEAAVYYEIVSEVHVMDGMVNTIESVTSYKLFNDEYQYVTINNHDDQMDFQMCVDQYWDGYVFNVIDILNMHKISFHNEIDDTFVNIPFKGVW